MEVLNKIAQLKAELDSLRPLDKDREAAIMQKLRLDWNYHSNHLEGNSLTFGETKALILFGITAAGKPLKDHFEMTGHDEAVKWVEDVVKEGRPLTEAFIRELHKLILKEPYESPTITPDGIPAKRIIHVGEYKTSPNHVLTPTGEILRFATPEETPALMHDLIEWYRAKESDPETHTLLLAAEFHYRFIRIHPFDDGNGRSARILMNFILMKHGYPPVVVKTEDKANYIAALQQSDAGMITPFIEYIGQNLAHSLEIMLRGARGENIDEPDDVDKDIALLKQKLTQIEKVTKTRNTLNGVLTNVITPLLDEFFRVHLKFAEFYENVYVSYIIDDKTTDYILVDGSLYFIKGKKANSDAENFHRNLSLLLAFSGKKDRELTYPLSNISKEIIDRLDVSLEFEGFSQENFPKFSYETMLTIKFDYLEFSVNSTNVTKTINKGYLSSLSEQDISNLTRAETKAHTDFINQQIEKAQQKNE